MNKWMYSLVAVPFLLFGCGGQVEIDQLDGVMPAIIEVDIQTAEQLNVGETVELAARVTQGEEVVNDADEVKFEVWESGFRTDGSMLDGELTEDGIYSVEYTFDHDGVYYMYAHTTARGLHVMPKKQLIVGNPDLSEIVEDNSLNSMEFVEEQYENNELTDEETNDD